MQKPMLLGGGGKQGCMKCKESLKRDAGKRDPQGGGKEEK